MSLLAGLGQGLMGAGQAVGQGLYAYAMAMREDERERMRQASIEKRWAVEDARIAKQDARYEQQQAKEEQRYTERSAKEDARYQDSVKFREQDANRANAREGRQDEKQSAMMLGQALERLDSIKSAKAKEVADMFTDPMTKQVTDPEAYRAAMSELQQSYIEDAGKIVQRSGLSSDQINKYGFSMFLPDSAPATEPAVTNSVEPQASGASIPSSFDIGGWAKGVRQPQTQVSGNAMPKPGETKREMAVDFLLNDRGEVTRKPGLLSPDAISQQNEYLKRLRESGVQSAYGASMMPR
ncbi:hypothetical protein [Shewanella sp. MM_2022_3]|uniref:hypothetical protein n=1 Tax=Shewanella sp. MM_2022_3 TaxID=2923280 RepID=UPI001F4C47B3|nr:hypothetical protein [Shewanella sp. MM_2022_3]MCH7421314.1 hypothetical protein [Shewanella sp. MM_2022_3]